MRELFFDELLMVNGAATIVTKLSVVEMDILVSYTTRFVGSGTYGGYRLNMILYPNAVHDLNDKLLPYDVSGTFFHNGHKIIPEPIEGGHLYKIFFEGG